MAADVDSLNVFAAGRSPTDSDKEDDREFLGDNPSTSTPPGMIMLLREGWAPIVVSATVKKPGTFQLAASGATGSFQFSQDGSTVLPGAVIFPSDDVEEGSLSRTGYVRPHPENAAIDSQITITGTITPKDNSHEAQDKVIVNMGVDLYIEDMSPLPVLPLGDDLTVDYKICGPATFSFEYVELHVYNSSDVLIYHVIVKRLRDKAGNLNAQGYPASGDVSVINDWTIRMY